MLTMCVYILYSGVNCIGITITSFFAQQATCCYSPNMCMQIFHLVTNIDKYDKDLTATAGDLKVSNFN